MIGFDEAFMYGKHIFGDALDHVTENDTGWVLFMDKNNKSLGEEQTWDEFENTWNMTKELDPGFVKFINVKKNWPKHARSNHDNI